MTPIAQDVVRLIRDVATFIEENADHLGMTSINDAMNLAKRFQQLKADLGEDLSDAELRARVEEAFPSVKLAAFKGMIDKLDEAFPDL